MAENVRQLQIVPKFNKQAIECLAELLEDAKAGRVLEIVCVAKLNDGTFDTCWTGAEDLIGLVGQLERIKHLTLRRMDT